LDAASLRIIIGQKGISEVHQEEEGLLIYFRANFKLPEASFQLLLAETGKTLTLIPGPRVGVRFRAIDEERSLDTLGRFLRLIFPAS
jgi:transcription-repair coupling factor (superfamily II helicase)